MLITTSDMSTEPLKWREALNSFPNAGVGHLHEWGEIIKRTYGMDSVYLAAMEGSEVKGLLPMVIVKSKLFPNAVVSMPYLNDGGILANGREAELFLWSEAKKLMCKETASYLELRHSYELDLGIRPRTDKISMVLDFSAGKENVWMKKLHGNVRNKIRKGEKLGVEVKCGVEYIKEFYDTHVINMQELGSPPHSLRFFTEIVDIFKSNVRVYVAMLKNKVIGGKIVIVHKDSQYFLWVASPRAYTKYAVVSIMNWRAITDAIEMGLKYCDFGRTTVGSSHFNFKKKWGASVKQLHWNVFPGTAAVEQGDNDKYGKYKIFSQVWKRLPLGIVKSVGPSLRKGLPQ